MPGPLVFFFALVALVTLATAAYFAFRPTERTLGILRPLAAATTYSALAAFFAGLTNGLYYFSRHLEDTPTWPRMVQGFAETPVPLVAGFAAISVTWLLVAVGLRRQA
jgi:hypothetical protein